MGAKGHCPLCCNLESKSDFEYLLPGKGSSKHTCVQSNTKQKKNTPLKKSKIASKRESPVKKRPRADDSSFQDLEEAWFEEWLVETAGLKYCEAAALRKRGFADHKFLIEVK